MGCRFRTYGPSSDRPGRRDPSLTPYMIPIERALAARRHKRVVGVMGAQMAKTELFLDVIGQRVDQRPTPIIYVGPTREWLTVRFEARVMELLDQAPTLRARVVRGRKMKKLVKWVGGVSLRLAYAGAAQPLKSDAAGLALIDEYDQMEEVPRAGDPLTLVEARGYTYADFCCGLISTPSGGTVDTVIEKSGLEFWRRVDSEDVELKIWKLWQEGTMFHWAWRCPFCLRYFIPRFKCLRWPEKATPREALRSAFVECPHCSNQVTEAHKAEMNETGRYVAPGQAIDQDGHVSGEVPDRSTISFWVRACARLSWPLASGPKPICSRRTWANPAWCAPRPMRASVSYSRRAAASRPNGRRWRRCGCLINRARCRAALCS